MSLVSYHTANAIADSFFKAATTKSSGDWSPIVDLVHQEDQFVLEIELSGVSKEDVSIDVDKNILQISGNKKSHHDDSIDALKRERLFGKFARNFRLSDDVMKEKIAANFKDGVLSIVLPKNQESMSKKINIE